jgi:putative MATE family efflux protein
VIAENLLETLLGIVDTILVARLGAQATAGVGSALQVMFFLIAALSALSIGSSVLVAQAIGAGDRARASQLARQSLLWSVLISIPRAIAGYLLAGPVVGVFQLEPDVAQISSHYLQVTMGTVVVLVGLFIGGGVLRGAGDTRTPMIVTGIANVINVGLAYSLIYGHAGLPALGAVGSAWATFIARAIALIILLAVLWQGRRGVSIRGGSWWPSGAVARQILTIGLPAALEQILTSAAFFVLTLVVASLGTVVLAAQQLSFTALSTSLLPGFGFGIAATTLVGQSVGARRIREGSQATFVALRWALIWMSTLGVVLFVLAAPILRVFTSDSAVVEAGTWGLRVVALAQPLWAVWLVLAGALRGTGNTRFPLAVGSVGMWLSAGLAALLALVFHTGLPGVWAAYLVVAPAVGGLLVWRFRRTVEEFVQAEQRQAAGGPA